jgi:uncharacterized tellurite resistance protein B-like protein
VAQQGTFKSMPIIVLVLGTLALWTVYWFVRMGGIDHFRSASAQRKEAERLARARASERSAPLRAIDDPREAAMILMVLMAREGGDPTREQIAAIEKTVRATFGFKQDLHERMTQARFIASRADSFAQAAALFADLFNKKLTLDEKRELVVMMEEVANFEGRREAHVEALDVLARRVGVAPAG